MQEEKQREIYNPSGIVGDLAALISHNEVSNQHKNFVSHSGQQRTYNKFNSNRRNVICNHCKILGHIVDSCYKLNGYPAGYKFNKGRKGSAYNAQGLTVDQYNHLVTLLNKTVS